MVVLRSFRLFLIVYALVAMEATFSKLHKVGQEKRNESKGKENTKVNKTSKRTVSKSAGTLKRHR